MRKIAVSLFLLGAFVAQAQTVYKVPRTIEFAGVSVRLDNEAQDIVQKDVNNLVASRRALDIKLERMAMYFPIVEAIFEDEEIPKDFRFLVVQESSLMPDAVSTSNAVGFWQFKKETAGDFGLRIDTDIDERKNIHASTRAAALYLKKNNAVLNNWVSALFSYRLGLGGVRNLVPKEWAYANEINVDAKTDWYVLRSLAHKYVFERELADYKASVAPILFEYKYANGKTFERIAQELGVDEENLRLHNRWVSATIVPDDKEYMMIVPVPASRLDEVRNKAFANSRTDFITTDIGFPVLKRITPSVKNKNLPIFYQINGKKGILAQDGDTPASLAKRADIKLEKFMTYNDLKERDRLIAGEVYYLKKKSRKAVVPFHTVTADQTLWKISQIYGIRLDRVLTLNRLEQVVKLQPGRVLYLRKKRPKNKPVEYITLPEAPPKDPLLNKTEPRTNPIVKKEDKKPDSPEPKPEDKSLYPTKPKTTPVDTPKPEKPDLVVVPMPKNDHEALSHTVTAGQTYYSVARQYGVSVQDLYQWNNLSETLPLKVGQKIRVSQAGSIVSPEQVKPVEAIFHEVQKGDTLYNISKRYNVAPEQIQEWNGLKDNAISIGQKLKIIKE